MWRSDQSSNKPWAVKVHLERSKMKRQVLFPSVRDGQVALKRYRRTKDLLSLVQPLENPISTIFDGVDG